MDKKIAINVIAVTLLLAIHGGAIALMLESPDIKEGQFIAKQFTCQGENKAPSLLWRDVPENTKSFVLIMDDPDAPNGTWVHWIVYNIPAKVRSLKEILAARAEFNDGMKQGMTSFGKIGYGGPCPPKGHSPHHYYFKLYALDTVLKLPSGATKEKIEVAMKNHILAKAQLMGIFQQPK